MRKKFFHIIGLYERACGDGLSPEEREEWERLMEEERWRCLWEELKSGALAKEGMESKGRFSAEEGFREFRRRTYGRARRRRIWLYRGIGAVAASLVVVLNVAFGWWSEWREEKEWKPYTVASMDGIYAERNQATLVLGSGQRVPVTAEMRQLEDVGGARVKMENGGVDYTKDEEVMPENVGEVDEVVYNELIVPMGGECFVVLEDSSRVWMNAGSRLRYPSRFTGEERGVELEGEAYFEVEHGERPFVVHTGCGDVRVLGTSFGVRVYEAEAARTTLVEGRVAFRGERDSLVLWPGEQAVVDENGFVTKQKVNVEEYVAWRQGIFVFDHRPLEEIARDLERWYEVRIIFMNEGLKHLPFTGHLQRYDCIETFLDLLEETGELTYEETGRTIYLREK